MSITRLSAWTGVALAATVALVHGLRALQRRADQDALREALDDS